MYVTKHLDWLACSFSQTVDPRMAFPLLDWRYMGAGLHGYRARYVSATTGADYQTESANPEMGSHVQFSGGNLEALRRDFGGTDDGLVNHLIRLDAKASRIDLTINLHEGHITPLSMKDALRKGTCKARANVSRFIEGKNGNVEGDTLYIGSPASDRQFRCYNKAAETGVMDKGAWIRLELELRRVRANGAFKSCKDNGVFATINGHMADFIDWREVEYTRALSGESVHPLDIPRKDTNRQRWLLGQVASALAKEIALDVSFRTSFDREVQARLDDLKISE